MKIERVNIVIPRALNPHKPNLNNEVMEFVRRVKVGGLYTNDRIELNLVPKDTLDILKNGDIKFEERK